jgi:1-phosphofructokinase family hexose kinase
VIVAVATSPSLDVLYVVPELRIGQIHRPVTVTRVAGGKGFNAARAANSIGAEVVAAGIVGGPTGEWIAQSLPAPGLTVALVPGAEQTRTSVSVEARDGSGLTEFYEPSAPVSTQEWADLEAIITHTLQPGDWLMVSGSLPQGAPAQACGRLVTLAHDLGASVGVDTHGAALGHALSAGPDLVKVNHHEAAAHLGVPEPARGDHDHDDDVVDAAVLAAHQLHVRAPRAVVTCGSRGAVAVTDDATLWARSAQTGRYPVGSGDAFFGALVGSLHAGQSMPSALRHATAAGVANALVPGAGVLDIDRYRILVDDVHVTPVVESST